MKRLFVFIALFAAQSANAYVFEQTECDGVELSVAENALQRAEGYFEVGMVTRGDVWVAKMNLAETKLCSSRQPDDRVDAQICADLLKLQNDIVSAAKTSMDVGLTTVDDYEATLVKQSKLVQFCSK